MAFNIIHFFSPFFPLNFLLYLLKKNRVTFMYTCSYTYLGSSAAFFKFNHLHNHQMPQLSIRSAISLKKTRGFAPFDFSKFAFSDNRFKETNPFPLYYKCNIFLSISQGENKPVTRCYYSSSLAIS